MSVPMKRLELMEDDGKAKIVRIERGRSAFTTRNGKEDCTIRVGGQSWGAGYSDEPGKLFVIDAWLATETGEELRQSDRKLIDRIGIHNLVKWGFLDAPA